MKTVMAHGTFDLLHPGHIKYLNYARGQGDYLIVALSSDYITRLRKGETRPVNPFNHRKYVLLGLRSVDEVLETPYDTDEHDSNLLKLVGKINPTIFVTSYSLSLDKIEFFTKNSIELIKAPYFSGGTTTSIVNRVIKREGSVS